MQIDKIKRSLLLKVLEIGLQSFKFLILKACLIKILIHSMQLVNEHNLT
jgi:ATP-dependent helicase/DNAse subunit B